jgi:hypothetical protein
MARRALALVRAHPRLAAAGWMKGLAFG